MKQRIRFLEQDHIDFCEHELASALQTCVADGDFPRVFLGFPSTTGELIARLPLKTDPEWPIAISEWTEGQIGATIRTGKVTRWPDEKVPYKEVARKTVQSVCYPVEIEEEIVAILLFDVFEGEPSVGPAFHRKASVISKTCGRILATARNDLAGLLVEIQHLTDLCRRDTGAKRGYSAIQIPGRAPLTITVGRDTQVFRELGFEEGLTGEVLRTGVPIILGNVWEHPSYLSSDPTINSEAVFPLIWENSLLGVLNIEAAPADHFIEERVSLAKEYAREIAELAHQYVSVSANPDSSFAQAVSYFSQNALTTGMAVGIDDPVSLLENLLSVLQQSVNTTGFANWSIRYIIETEFASHGVVAPETGTYTQTIDGRNFITRIFGFSRGRVLFCIEISADRHLDSVSIGRIDFLCRAAVSEYRRRMSEWSLLGIKNLAYAALQSSISVEQLALSYLDEMCAFLEADIACGFRLVRGGLNDGRYVPFCYTDNATETIFRSPYKHILADDVDLLLSNEKDSRQVCVPAAKLDKFQSRAPSKSPNARASVIMEAGESKVSGAVIIPLSDADENIGFIRFSRFADGLEQRFDQQTLQKANSLFEFLNGRGRRRLSPSSGKS